MGAKWQLGEHSLRVELSLERESVCIYLTV